MKIASLLIANRGEISIRIARACAELGLRSVAVFSPDDAQSLHVRAADEAHALRGAGATAYLDGAQLIAVAQAAKCDAVHPGYGFLSESAAFARACAEAGLIFVGPRPEVLDLFGDKTAARELARRCNVPIPAGTKGATSLAEARDFLSSLGPGAAVVIKAVMGGGGRGMRVAASVAELEEAYARCRSEARAAFGRDEVYVEELIAEARHIEAQVVGDGAGRVMSLGERECSLQRRHQKLVEIAPSPSLAPSLRERIIAAALRMAGSAEYGGLGTFEFLVSSRDERFVFIEANPRLQVEHTVTEEVYNVDLVKIQLRIAGGATLEEIGLSQSQVPRGFAIQLRVNLETMQPDGGALPSSGTITAYALPSGPGVRVDGYGYTGYRVNTRFDPLLAKLIAHAPEYRDAVMRARRALDEFQIEGVPTNLGFLAALLDHTDVVANQVTTRWLDAHAAQLVSQAARAAPRRFFPQAETNPAHTARPLPTEGPEGALPVLAPMQGLVVSLEVKDGDPVRHGQAIAVLEAMKMEHVVTAEVGGIVRLVSATKGEVMAAGQPLVFIEPAETEASATAQEEEADLDAVRPDLAEAMARHALTLDAARPEAVARRHKLGFRTARENVEDLCDPGSFIEYGALTMAAQRSRRSMEDLLRSTPADGVIAGLGTVNDALFGEERSSCMVIAYDYTVLAGTQGTMNHKKQDRMFQLAAKLRRPLVLFAEGGGGRPGDTDKIHTAVAGLDIETFQAFARLSGLVPLIGVVNGRCFAGNAALLGCCDVIIATESATIGMGGPAMIEGGGLGVYQPEEVGPVNVQAPNGVIDVMARDEAEAVAVAKRYLSYFQGPVAEWSCADQRLLRRSIPENRLRVYDVRKVIRTLADDDSALELRPSFGLGMVTALIRIEGRPMGLIANNPMHQAGAIDADDADKAARFVQLCDAFDLPILSLCDTPGFMVGPEAERAALVRRCCRMFVNGANLSVPYFTVVLRKGYGLGAQAMAGGWFHSPVFTVSWPTGEFGGMGLEGAVRLGFRKELEAIADPAEREAEFHRRVEEMYARGKALSAASVLEIDNVIDPAETRRWIVRGLRAVPAPAPREGKKRTHIETW
ncbi:MAG: Acetyl-coenzyme A carboxylase carboxyl transferase subunit alpha [Acidobacteria bacterium]|nr:Acetyl-coenzyme A carboxylase carboxyl transferase subunit alpha [Acidobacteriota bacterium]